MSTINPANDELKSDIVKITPVIAKDAVIKTVNGIIDYLKRYSLSYQDAINKPIDNNSDNKITIKNYDMTTFKEKIDNLQYLSAPITVQDMRVEINKIVDIFKTDLDNFIGFVYIGSIEIPADGGGVQIDIKTICENWEIK